MYIYPIRFKPVYKDYIWGGSKIRDLFQREIALSRCAESWEVSSREDGMCYISNGAYKGMPFQKLIEKYPEEVVGRYCEHFPLLIKVIDAFKDLSVQVHPNEQIAKQLFAEPKTEMWVILDADPDSVIYAGFQPNTSKKQVEEALRDKTIAALLRKLPVTKGDVIFIPAGTVHAIGKGCLIYEVQQNSNTTYRLHDWNRIGVDGKPRALHIQQSLKSLQTSSHPEIQCEHKLILSNDKFTVHELIRSKYFVMHKVELLKEGIYPLAKRSFSYFFPIEGQVSVQLEGYEETCSKGQGFFLPSIAKELLLQPLEEKTVLYQTILL